MSKNDEIIAGLKPESRCIHAGYRAGNGEPMALPIYQSTTYEYESTEEIAKIFDLTENGHMYSRISNPTVEFFEKKLAALEGGVAAVCTVSGQSSVFLSLFNILGCGDHFIAGAKIYGGSTNLFGMTMKRMGIECTFVDFDDDDETIEKAFRPNTKAVFGEMLTNPTLTVLDVERIAKLAHKHGVPLIVDNTFPTPVLCRPIEFGADVVVHSTSKYLDGHGLQIGGCVVDSGNFDWDGSNGKYPGLTEPDESYHGLVYTKSFGRAAYANKLRCQLVRDFGLCPPAVSAFITDTGTQTLGVRMKAHCENAMAAAKFFASSDKVESVCYPGLENDKYHSLAMKYLPNGQSGVIAVVFKGGREAGIKFMDSLKLARNVVHVASVQTLVLHPASETHRQLSDAQLIAAGVMPGLVRVSMGIENISDILADFAQALEKV